MVATMMASSKYMISNDYCGDDDDDEDDNGEDDDDDDNKDDDDEGDDDDDKDDDIFKVYDERQGQPRLFAVSHFIMWCKHHQ